MLNEQQDEVRAELKALSEKYNLSYVIAVGKIEDGETEIDKTSERLLFYSKELETSLKHRDHYIEFNWLWRTGMNISAFARNIVDDLIRKFKLITVPIEKLSEISDLQKKRIENEAEQNNLDSKIPEGLDPKVAAQVKEKIAELSSAGKVSKPTIVDGDTDNIIPMNTIKVDDIKVEDDEA